LSGSPHEERCPPKAVVVSSNLAGGASGIADFLRCGVPADRRQSAESCRTMQEPAASSYTRLTRAVRPLFMSSLASRSSSFLAGLEDLCHSRNYRRFRRAVDTALASRSLSSVMLPLGAEAHVSLLARFAQSGDQAIVVPVADGRRGNPVLWPHDWCRPCWISPATGVPATCWRTAPIGWLRWWSPARAPSGR
jgi:hypothetical protein